MFILGRFLSSNKGAAVSMQDARKFIKTFTDCIVSRKQVAGMQTTMNDYIDFNRFFQDTEYQ